MSLNKSNTFNIIQTHSPQGQYTGTHFLILRLNIAREREFLISGGMIFHIFGPRAHKVSVPNRTI